MHEYPPREFPIAGILGAAAVQLGVMLPLGIWMFRKSRRPHWGDAPLWAAAGFFVLCCLWIFLMIPRRPEPPLAQMFRTGMPLLQMLLIPLGVVWSLIRLRNHHANYTIEAVLTLAILAFGLLFVCPLPLVVHPPEATWRSICRDNLKQVGLAIHSHYDVKELFPLAASGDPPRSWRVELLPFLDEAALHQRYDVSQPWDAPENDPLAKTFVRMYVCPSENGGPAQHRGQTDRPVNTAYAIPIGVRGIYSDGPPKTFRQMPDGSSNTILVVEACGQNIVWTEPRDVPFDELPVGVNLPGERRGTSAGPVSSSHQGGAHVLFADGSTKFLSAQIDPAILKQLLQADDGSPSVDEFW